MTAMVAGFEPRVKLRGVVPGIFRPVLSESTLALRDALVMPKREESLSEDRKSVV